MTIFFFQIFGDIFFVNGTDFGRNVDFCKKYIFKTFFKNGPKKFRKIFKFFPERFFCWNFFLKCFLKFFSDKYSNFFQKFFCWNFRLKCFLKFFLKCFLNFFFEIFLKNFSEKYVFWFFLCFFLDFFCKCFSEIIFFEKKTRFSHFLSSQFPVRIRSDSIHFSGI